MAVKFFQTDKTFEEIIRVEDDFLYIDTSNLPSNLKEIIIKTKDKNYIVYAISDGQSKSINIYAVDKEENSASK